jgi:hypothetical protein
MSEKSRPPLSPEEREKMRKKSLEIFNEILDEEDSEPPVPDESSTEAEDIGDDYVETPKYRESEKRARQLLGLDIIWELLTEDEKEKLLKSKERMSTYKNIDTTTNPRQEKIKQKKGIISEIVRGGLISEGILKNFSTVYIGSGVDIEYPLALGARKIEMVDPLFEDQKAVDYIIEKLSSLLGKEITQDEEGVLNVLFDFGDGPETLSIRLVSKPYHQEISGLEKPKEMYLLPDKIGLILLFASYVDPDKNMESHIVEDGGILYGRTLAKYLHGAVAEPEIIELGKRED